MNRQRTAGSVLVGALVSIVAGFLPILTFVGPLLGGAVAGALQRSGLRAGAIAGGAMGIFLAVLGVLGQLLESFLPPYPIAVVLGPWARGFGMGEESLAIVYVVSAMLLVVVGAFGGAIGGRLAGQANPRKRGKLGERLE